ncbi:MAG: type I glyceraldehyde-3-phosphate dehydrogenase [Gemmatimonadota bacterium]
MARIAINGLGRIGRATLKIAHESAGLEPVAANDIASSDDLAYLLRYDTVYGRYAEDVAAGGDRLRIGDTELRIYGEKDPGSLPWSDLDVDVVFECTGVFTRPSELRKHLDAGARHAVLSAPAKRDEGEGDELAWVVYGVNHPRGGDRMMSCASCTTNAITPIVEVLDRRLGVAKAVMTTAHAYTSTQELVDSPSEKPRRGRAAAMNLVPTSTGAAEATTKVLTEHQGRFDGVALRAPVAVGSIADVVVVAGRETSAEEVNAIFSEEAESTRYRGIVGVSDEPLVSSDIIGDPHAAVIDLGMTRVVDGDLVKVMGWYDNEWGYAAQMVRTAEHLAREI